MGCDIMIQRLSVRRFLAGEGQLRRVPYVVHGHTHNYYDMDGPLVRRAEWICTLNFRANERP